jgi:hypothetical protein
MSKQQDPSYSMHYLGSTDAYDVYDVIIYPSLLDSHIVQNEYKQELRANLEQAKRNNRRVWNAVHLSRMSMKEMVSLTYRIVLPFLREPLQFKVYDVSDVTIGDEQTRMLDRLVRSTFQMTTVATRDEALPPGFKPTIEGGGDHHDG